jgi:hypothetical protein
MSGDEGRTMYLLGAGASVDAGLPGSVDLTERIVKAIEARRLRDDAATINYVVGAMIANDTRRGGGVYDGVDAERVFSAVQALASRDTHELAPFVSSWGAPVDLRGPTSLDESWARGLMNGIFQDGSFHDNLIRSFEEGVRRLSGGDNRTGRFASLEQSMVALLAQVLRVTDPPKIRYLSPLLADASQGTVRIATLNYDTTIELCASDLALNLDTGLQRWDGGYGWSWDPQSEVRLLKVHGSLDWAINDRDGKLTYMGYSDPNSTLVGGKLAVVFGTRGKLRPDGPFLAMLLSIGCSAPLIV